jgi:signal transduction histidine kinase
MGALRRFVPGTIAGQITGLVVAAVLLGLILASGVFLYLISQEQAGGNRDILVAIRAAHIAAVTREALSATSQERMSLILRRPHPGSVEVRLVSTDGLAPWEKSGPDTRFIDAVAESLHDNWGFEPLRRVSQSHDENSIFLDVGGHRALQFEASSYSGLHNLVFVQTIGALAIITLSILFLSVYAVRWIVSPLSSIASAARDFGRAAGADEDDLGVGGPREIEEVAQALNDMRRRVRALVNERTQMLVAISHDLRTPLTRLRLRAERVRDEPLRAAMMQDIGKVGDMLTETLAYVREGSQREQPSLSDLPSLLETIAAEFSDVGHKVCYRGPDRLAFAGRAQAIGRAVTNVVENGTKFGSHVEIALRSLGHGMVEIQVDDDGPGISPALLGRVFEPFFKGDSARSVEGRGGFGLGLSIARDIVERHGGAIELVNREPHGVSVRTTFKPLQLLPAWEATSAA